MAPLSCRRTTNDRAYLIIASGRSIICHRRWRCVRPAPSSPAPSPAVHMVVLRVGSSVAASSLLRVGRSCDSCMQCTPPFAVTAVFDTGYTPWVGGGSDDVRAALTRTVLGRVQIPRFYLRRPAKVHATEPTRRRTAAATGSAASRTADGDGRIV